MVLECLYNDGDEVLVLENMMVIGQPGEEYVALIGGNAPAAPKAEMPETFAANNITQSGSSITETVTIRSVEGLEFGSNISPRARILASREAVNIIQIEGTGPKGRIVERDIEKVLENQPKLTPLARKIAAESGLQPQGAGSGLAGTAKSTDLLSSLTNETDVLDYNDKKISNMRKIIAKSMHVSLQNSAQLTHHLGADARRILELRKQVKAAMETGKITTNITLNDLVCYAVIKALKKFPNENSHFLGDTMRLFNKYIWRLPWIPTAD